MLRLDDVSCTFGHVPGLMGVTLELPAGQVVALVGMNGAGKTTLMRLALGMLRPDQGTVRLFGQPLATLPGRQWRHVGAFVEVPLAYPELTVRENLRIAMLLRGTERARVEEALDDWRLGPIADRRYRRLSLGNKQRVGLAAALQHDPRLVVLDEPTNALDPASVIVLREYLVRRARDGAAVLVSSHHLDEVARIADRIVVVNAGRLIGELDPTAPDLERLFFAKVLADDAQREERA